MTPEPTSSTAGDLGSIIGGDIELLELLGTGGNSTDSWLGKVSHERPEARPVMGAQELMIAGSELKRLLVATLPADRQLPYWQDLYSLSASSKHAEVLAALPGVRRRSSELAAQSGIDEKPKP